MTTADLVPLSIDPIRAKVSVTTLPGVRISAGTYVTGPNGATFETLVDAMHRPKGWAAISWWLRRWLWGTRFLIRPVVPPDRVPARSVDQYYEDE